MKETMKKVINKLTIMGCIVGFGTCPAIHAQDVDVIDLSAGATQNATLELVDETRRAPEKPRLPTVDIKNIKKYMETKAKELSKKTSPETKATQSNMQTIIDNISAHVTQQLEKSNRHSIDQAKLDFVFKIALKQILDIVPKYITSQNVYDDVDTYIKEMFDEREVAIADIPQEMKKEYTNRRTAVILNIKNILDKRKSDKISDTEVNSMVKNAFSGFIDRMINLLTWQWANANIANARNSDSGDRKETPSSYIKPNPDVQRMYQPKVTPHARPKVAKDK